MVSGTPLSNSDDKLDFYNDEKLRSMVHKVSSRDIYMHHLYSKAINTMSRKLKIKLIAELENMLIIDEIFS